MPGETAPEPTGYEAGWASETPGCHREKKKVLFLLKKSLQSKVCYLCVCVCVCGEHACIHMPMQFLHVGEQADISNITGVHTF
jgi:hypothetical protein